MPSQLLGSLRPTRGVSYYQEKPTLIQVETNTSWETDAGPAEKVYSCECVPSPQGTKLYCWNRHNSPSGSSNLQGSNPHALIPPNVFTHHFHRDQSPIPPTGDAFLRNSFRMTFISANSHKKIKKNPSKISMLNKKQKHMSLNDKVRMLLPSSCP